MGVLALDIATTTGYAHTNGISGARKLKGRGLDRCHELIKFLYELALNNTITTIVAEAVHVRFVKAAIPLLEMRGAVMGWCIHNDVKFVGDITPGMIKKHATGSGSATKADMIETAQALYAYVKDDNHADALHLLNYYETVVNS
jgi:Holliday junction resolvasome RuvABC endonuclease subunit